MTRRPRGSTRTYPRFPCATLFRSGIGAPGVGAGACMVGSVGGGISPVGGIGAPGPGAGTCMVGSVGGMVGSVTGVGAGGGEGSGPMGGAWVGSAGISCAQVGAAISRDRALAVSTPCFIVLLPVGRTSGRGAPPL